MAKRDKDKYIYIKVVKKGLFDKLRGVFLPNQQIVIEGETITLPTDEPVYLPDWWSSTSGVIIAVKTVAQYKDRDTTVWIPGTHYEYIHDLKGKFFDNKAAKLYMAKYNVKPKSYLLDKLMKIKPPEPEEGFYIDPDIWYFLLRQIWRREQVLLIGASGTGKTEMVQYLVNRVKKEGLDLGLEIFDMAIQNPEASLKGTLQIENGRSYFRLARFARVIQRPNTLVLLDELNRGDTGVQNILMPLLDSRKTLYVERHEPEELKVGEGTFFWATANLGASFVGAGAIDEAVAQRFTIIKIDYLPADVEARVLTARTGIPLDAADRFVALANMLRNDSTFPYKPSMRHLLIAAKLYFDGFSFEQAVMFGIYSQLAMLDTQLGGDEYKRLVKEMLKNV